MNRLSNKAGQAEKEAPGFSLVEITLAMGIAAVALIAILGMLPHAMKFSRDGADQTAIGAVLEDVHDRLKGNRLEEGEVDQAPFFYDQQGRFWSSENQNANQLTGRRFFRVEVMLTKPNEISGNQFPTSMLTAVLKLYWPLDETGQPYGEMKPRTTVSYPVTALTGPEWETVDPDFKPKVEY
ncbi:MAG: hypothetical protein KDN19_09700 [Verrucomicrobiae bacterium]|nr:hypothetical protein [Verrucomicrobiae bacterium]